MFVPFQRLGDTDNTTGVGLGLALSRGLTEAMGGTLTADDTPGGGLTMTVSVPAVTEPGYDYEPGHRERAEGGAVAPSPASQRAPAATGLTSDEGARREGAASKAPGGERENRASEREKS